MVETILKKVLDIKVIDELYPRNEKDTRLIQQYAEDISVLPPIEINQNDILIDGFHRLSAYKQCKIEEIPCIVTVTQTEDELFWLAVDRNNSFGWQLSRDSKKKIAIKTCGGLHDDEYIIQKLSIDKATYNRWTKNKRDQLEEERDKKIIDLWMQCNTQEQIAESVDVDHSTVSRITAKFVQSAQKSQMHKDFTPQLYNIWNFAKNNNETKHFGNVPVEIVENLLYYYTKPFDIVFDPFGGGGITIDACKKWLRRYYVCDIQPTEIALQKDMHTHDITKGLPEELPRPNFVFLDPPYWIQGKGQYTEISTDLSNMSLNDFYKVFDTLFKLLHKKIVDGGHIAFIIQNTQWLNENKKQEPHSHVLWNIAENAGFTFESIIHVPYSSQQYNPQMVEYAKNNRIFLELNRELVVFCKV